MRHRGVARPWLPDVVGVAWTVLAVAAVMSPVLRPGVHLGSFDLLSRVGLTRQPGVAVHSQFPADQVLYFLPFTNLAWQQVHAGHLPLWDPYNVLGVPYAFTWQSGVFSVPLLVSYLVPLHAAYTVIVASKLVIAGTGAYVLCRVLGTGALGAAFGGTVFELSGPMLHYSGWAMTGVTCWAGWIFAAALLLVRGAHRRRDGALLAVFVAASVYGGHPESLVVLGVSLVVFTGVVIGRRAASGVAPWRPLLRVGGAGACGVALGAPLLLPGLQVVGLSGRAAASGGAPYAFTHITDLATGLQGTDFRVPSPYVGALTVVLAVAAVRALWSRAEVLALAAVAVVGVILTFQSPLYSVIQAAPVLHQVTWNRDVMLLALALAVLGALGLDALVGGRAPAATDGAAPAAGDEAGDVVRRWTWRGLVVTAVIGAGVALAVGLGAQKTGAGSAAGRLAAAGASVVVGALFVRGRLVGRRWAAAGIVGTQAVVLVVAGVSFWSISAGTFPATAATAALQRDVGSATVSIGPCEAPISFPDTADVGIRPNANVAYGVHEFAVYEPALYKAYYDSWQAASGEQLEPRLRRVGLFCPQITTVAEARLYGVSYVLQAPRTRVPTGMVQVAVVGGEELLHVPGSGQATLSPAPAPGAAVPTGTPGTPVAVTRPTPASLRVVTDARTPQVLRLRVTAVPGWTATLDGRPLPLTPWASGAMLEARLPAGHHVVELRYWPAAFGAGIDVAVVVVAGFVVVALASAVRARRRRPRPAPAGLSVPSASDRAGAPLPGGGG